MVLLREIHLAKIKAGFVAVTSLALLWGLCISTPPVSARAPGMPPKGKVMLGVGGTATTPQKFSKLAGQEHQIHLVSLGWGQGVTWGGSYDHWLTEGEQGDYRTMFHLDTRDKNGKQAITPGDLAKGDGDRILLKISQALNESDQYTYMRPMAEMNGHWNPWCAFNQNGSRRGAKLSTANYRKAFIRIAIIMRAGTQDEMNEALTGAGLDPLTESVGDIDPSDKVALVWNPQGEGAPNVKGNQPRDYFPGNKWVDYVANDLYSIGGKAHWKAHNKFYNDFPNHPFMVAEWAPWEIDDARFAKDMMKWVTTHRRTVAVLYFNGTGSNIFKLATKPETKRAYKKAISGSAKFSCSICGAFTT